MEAERNKNIRLGNFYIFLSSLTANEYTQNLSEKAEKRKNIWFKLLSRSKCRFSWGEQVCASLGVAVSQTAFALGLAFRTLDKPSLHT